MHAITTSILQSPLPIHPREPIVLHLDRSRPDHLCLERDGKPVDLEAAFLEGFMVSASDSSVILTLATRFVVTRAFNAQ